MVNADGPIIGVSPDDGIYIHYLPNDQEVIPEVNLLDMPTIGAIKEAGQF